MVKYDYIPSKNLKGRFISGVPLRDLTLSDIESLPAHKIAAIEAADFYVEHKEPEPEVETGEPTPKKRGKVSKAKAEADEVDGD